MMLGSVLQVGGRDPELGRFTKQNPILHGAQEPEGGGAQGRQHRPGAAGHGRPPLPQRWRARLVFVTAALALVPSLAGCQPCGYSMYSARRAKFVIAQD